MNENNFIAFEIFEFVLSQVKIAVIQGEVLNKNFFDNLKQELKKENKYEDFEILLDKIGQGFMGDR